MSGLNTRLAIHLKRMLAQHGFDATLQQRSDNSTNDFEISTPTITDTPVRAVWDNPRQGIKTVNDGAQSSISPRFATIAYRSDVKATAKAVGLKLLVDGVVSDVLSITPIGDKVGLRLHLQTGIEP